MEWIDPLTQLRLLTGLIVAAVLTGWWWLGLTGIVPLVRVGKSDPLLISKALDTGAAGVIVPRPDEPYQYLPGFCLARTTNSCARPPQYFSISARSSGVSSSS